ncbi:MULTISPECIES: iron ABC transporter substrate-binding protein [Pseudarthrobacter]|uniref:iron ABC transporter substrate-binding protein n=1 Tax=Pseudarthrobacter TaxID=1742993 RepID=UPI0013DD027E|nr:MULTISPECIES: iron ABC transporter substrate-binding protein [Pseudarthrobacter]MDP9997073.1 iron(III) transport system substrate-binding protein [Pseudarthrobacter sulfonivorans]
MKIRSSALAGIALAATAALGLTACGGSTTPAATTSPSASAEAVSGEITVYNAQHESMTKAWVEEFTKETGVKVTLRQGKDTEMSNQIIQEGDKSPADVFITENSPAMTQVENAGLFADLTDEVKNQVPAEYRPSTNKWTGVAARSTVFVYNKEKLTEDKLPKSLSDLAGSEWKGRWGASPSGADFQAIVSAYLELKGEAETEQWLTAMKENFKGYQGNGAVLKAVNAGEIEGGVIYHYYYFGDQAKTGENSNNVASHYFKNQDPGAFVSISGGGVLKSSKNKAAADAFLAFITGKKGQEQLQTGKDFEYTVGSGVASNEKLVPLAELQAPTVDSSKLNSKKVTELMTKAGLL